jgi:MYXO-CTERM domain-containing protein
LPKAEAETMIRVMRLLALGLGVMVFVSASGAAAHIELDSPAVRVAGMKTGPCGATSSRATDPAKITTIKPGQTVTIQWHETVAHPGFFRIAFSEDGTTFPTDPSDPPAAAAFPVLAIIPKVGGQTTYSADITMPDMECDSCTIQLIQYMQRHAPPPYYYQCADIVLSNTAAPSPAAETAAEETGCACSSAGSSKGSLGVAAIAALALLAAHVRRRR